MARKGFLLLRIASLITSNDFVILYTFLKNDEAEIMPNDKGDNEHRAISKFRRCHIEIT